MNIIRNILFYLTIGVAVVDWIAADKSWKIARFVTKPLTLILLIAWFTYFGRWQDGLLWFGLALAFSLLGDILLFWDKLFIGGLVAFALAHIFYIIGFNPALPPFSNYTLFILLGVIVVATILMRTVMKAMKKDPHKKAMQVPVIIYTVIIGLMLISAVLTFFRAEWSFPTALLVSIGAALFFASDSMIAFRNFVGRFAHDDYLVMATYHLGQIMITAGVLMNFVKA